MTKFTSGAAGGGGVAAGVATATGGGFALESVKKRPKKGQIVGQNFNIGLMGNSEPV